MAPQAGAVGGVSAWWRLVAVVVVVAVWLSAFALRLASVPLSWWAWRDDAVITFSHGLNLAAFGTVGVSPGDRSEGSSSPLGVVVSAMVTSVGDIGYKALAIGTFVVCLIVAGAASALLLRSIADTAGVPPRAAAVGSATVAGGVGVVLACSWTVSGWLASGMENALIVASAFLVVYLTVVPRPRALSVTALVVMLAALGLARVEFAFFAVPVVVAAAFLLARRTTPERRRVTATAVVAVPAIVWLTVHLVRLFSFGSLFPTTALVQGKSLTAWGVLWWGALVVVWLALALSAVGLLGTTRQAGAFWGVVAAVAVIGVLGLALFPSPAEEGKARLFWLLALVAGCCALVAARLVVGVRWPADALLAALTILPLGQYLVLGEARMDPFRVLFLAVPMLVLWIGAGCLTLWGAVRGAASDRPRQRLRLVLPVVMATVAVAVPLVALRLDPPAKLGWEIDADPTLDGVAAFSSALPAGVLAISANPDLGKVSFAKDSLVVDLGYLGEPLLARLNADRPDLRAVYLNEVMVPDVVESHGAWSCAHHDWLSSAEFGQRYAVLRSDTDSAGFPDCPVGGALTVWQRTDAVTEIELARELAESSDPVAVVRAALADCRDRSQEVFGCEPVTRAVWRANQVLRAGGTYDAVLAEFEASPSGGMDRLLLERPAGWGQSAYAEFVRLADGRPQPAG